MKIKKQLYNEFMKQSFDEQFELDLEDDEWVINSCMNSTCIPLRYMSLSRVWRRLGRKICAPKKRKNKNNNED
jgi:hypothetical protein